MDDDRTKAKTELKISKSIDHYTGGFNKKKMSFVILLVPVDFIIIIILVVLTFHGYR